MKLVVDASAALPWFVRTPHSDEALGLLREDAVVMAPDLVLPELANTAWKLARARRITGAHSRRLVAAAPGAFDRLVASSLLLDRAFALAAELEHAVYDCMYLALAQADGATLVTADKHLARKAGGVLGAGRLHVLGTRDPNL